MNETESIPDLNSDREIAIRKFRFKFWVLDVATIVFSYILAYLLRNNFGDGLVYSNNYIYLLILMIPTFFILIRKSNFTHVYEKFNFSFILFNFFQLCFFGLLIIFSFLFIFKMKDISRVFIFIFFIIYMINLSLLQIYRSQSFRKLSRKSDVN